MVDGGTVGEGIIVPDGIEAGAIVGAMSGSAQSIAEARTWMIKDRSGRPDAIAFSLARRHTWSGTPRTLIVLVAEGASWFRCMAVGQGWLWARRSVIHCLNGRLAASARCRACCQSSSGTFLTLIFRSLCSDSTSGVWTLGPEGAGSVVVVIFSS